LIETVRTIHAVSRGTYGAPRVHAELAAAGVQVGKNRVARLMHAAGVAGVSRRKFGITTVRDGARQAPDLVDRRFTADAPNVLWVADIAYIPTWAGFLYLAVVLDVFNRRIVGWSMSTTLHTTVVLDALSMALDQPILQRCEHPFATAARLRRVGRDVLDAEPIERPSHLA
jgi:putative transposase